MNNTRTSVFNMVSDMDAEISKAKAVLDGVQTYVEYRFQDGDYGDIQCLVRYNAENIQVLLSIMESMLNRAETVIKELDEALHSEPTGEVSA